jgi:nitrite reductase/ring-hydroxylating ferredoxin subunit
LSTAETAKLRRFAGRQRIREAPVELDLMEVESGTPCGAYLRCFWQPVTLSSELHHLPKSVTLMGENLVLFRTGKGSIGLLERHCCHRGTSLEYGIITDVGISCCYHGWHYAVDGTILETPNDPKSTVKETLRHTAYPTLEWRGIVFAYLGPPGLVPPFPKFDVWQDNDTEMVPYAYHYPCHWLQVHENSQDPVHNVFLHTRSSGAQFAEARGAMPVMDFFETPIGVMSLQARRRDANVWVRINEVIMPNMNQGGAIWERGKSEKCFQRGSGTSWKVPMDYSNTLVIGWRFFNDRVDPEGRGDRSRIGWGMVDSFGQHADDRSYEEHQRQPGDYDAMTGQGTVNVHALENLTATDRGISLIRRKLRRGIKAVQEGCPLADPHLQAADCIQTYTQDTIIGIPQHQRNDERIVGEVARKIAQIDLASAGTAVEFRAEEFARMVNATKWPQ